MTELTKEHFDERMATLFTNLEKSFGLIVDVMHDKRAKELKAVDYVLKEWGDYANTDDEGKANV